MKTILKGFIIFAVLVVFVIAFYLYNSHSIEQEQKYLFSIDLIKSLKACLESREGSVGDERLKNLETIYRGREKLLQAKEILENWKNNKNENIRKLSEDFLQGVNELIFAQDLFEKIFKESSKDTESDLALAGTKLERGRERIFSSSLDIISVISSRKKHETEKKPVHFELSKKQLESLVSYIDNNFEKEINEYKDKEKQKKDGKIETYTLSQETWAVVLIKNFIEKGELLSKEEK